MLERIRAGFSLEAMFGDELASAAIVDGFVAALGPHVSDDFVCVMDGGPMTTSYEGIEGLRRGWEDFLGAFEALQIEPVDAMEGADGDLRRRVRPPQGATTRDRRDDRGGRSRSVAPARRPGQCG